MHLLAKGVPIYNYPTISLRLHDAVAPFETSMAESYSKLSGFVTELKMDHKDGKVKSDRLEALLVLACF